MTLSVSKTRHVLTVGGLWVQTVRSLRYDHPVSAGTSEERPPAADTTRENPLVRREGLEPPTGWM